MFSFQNTKDAYNEIMLTANLYLLYLRIEEHNKRYN